MTGRLTLQEGKTIQALVLPDGFIEKGSGVAMIVPYDENGPTGYYCWFEVYDDGAKVVQRVNSLHVERVVYDS